MRGEAIVPLEFVNETDELVSEFCELKALEGVEDELLYIVKVFTELGTVELDGVDFEFTTT